MNEKSSPWFKAFALCTAFGLGGTYVWRQQQKTAPQIEKTVERTVLSGSKSAVIAPPPSPVDQVETDRVLMPGSKSFAIDPAALPVDEKKTNHPAIQQEPEVKERVLMPGSKSGRVLPTPEIPVAPQLRTVLPSSKSISPILDPPKADKP